MDKINLILGTMQFGERIFGEDAQDMIELFGESGYRDIDTAYVYNEGESESLIGKALVQSDKNFRIATKISPRITGRLDNNAVITQFNESLKRMNLDYVDILYLHFPDPNTPMESALEASMDLYTEGKIKEFGLSNFPAWMVAEAFNICKERGWMLPTIYEGLYNPLSRHAERELDKALDYYNMRFYAYNPLAGGLLTDKYKDKTIKEGRFINRLNYQDRYWHETYFEAIERIDLVCKEYEINITEATYRWLAYHSMLSPSRGDGIIIGASSKAQLIKNLSYVSKGVLPIDIVKVINSVWDVTRSDAPEYFKFYVPEI